MFTHVSHTLKDLIRLQKDSLVLLSLFNSLIVYNSVVELMKLNIHNVLISFYVNLCAINHKTTKKRVLPVCEWSFSKKDVCLSKQNALLKLNSNRIEFHFESVNKGIILLLVHISFLNFSIC